MLRPPEVLFGTAGLDDGDKQTIFGYPLFGSTAETMRNLRKALEYLLSNPSDMVGCETANIINSDIPDCFDIRKSVQKVSCLCFIHHSIFKLH